jgi:two-component system, OmpR family, response regulator
MAKLESVLIIDDSERCIEFISLALQAEGGIEVHKETRSTHAAERVRIERPSLVLLDLKMPELDGFGVLQQLRSNGVTAPVVMLSGSARQADIDRAYALGCSGYLEKPATLTDYRQTASAIVNFWGRGELPAANKRPTSH